MHNNNGIFPFRFQNKRKEFPAKDSSDILQKTYTDFYTTLNGLGIDPGPGIGLDIASDRPCPAAGSATAASEPHGTLTPYPAV